MMKKLTVFLLFFVACVGLAGSAMAWEKIGEKRADFGKDKDQFNVGKKEGKFTQIQIRVKDAPVEIRSMTVELGDGTKFRPNVQGSFRPNSQSRPIDIPGNRKRTIKSVTFQYASVKTNSKYGKQGKNQQGYQNQRDYQGQRNYQGQRDYQSQRDYQRHQGYQSERDDQHQQDYQRHQGYQSQRDYEKQRDYQARTERPRDQENPNYRDDRNYRNDRYASERGGQSYQNDRRSNQRQGSDKSYNQAKNKQKNQQKNQKATVEVWAR